MNLTVGQSSQLDRLAKKDEDAKVTGWDMSLDGPVVQRGDGRVQIVKRDGRLKEDGFAHEH